MSSNKDASPRASSGGTVKQDLLASVVVFLVALPLCMGIAIASGVPVAAGLITGIVGGLVVGFLAGSPLQVSGPAAGLTVIVLVFVKDFGLPLLGAVVLLAGFLQLLAGVFHLGQWFRAVSPAVIKGMLAGIGVLIFASQFHVMVDDNPKGNGLENLKAIPGAIAKGLPMPIFGTLEERQFRAAKLKEIGALHEHQQEVQELVAERVSREVTEEEFEQEALLLQPLVQRQAEISTHLQRVVGELDHFKVNTENRDFAQQLHDAAVGALAQSNKALDDLEQERVRAVTKSQTNAVDSLQNLLGSLTSHSWAAKFGLITIGIIVLWQMFVPQKLKMIPGALVAVVVATAGAFALAAPVLYVEVPDNLLDGLHFPSLIVLADAPLWSLLQAAVVLAVVASAETLLCATAVDQMHQGPRTNYDRELWAQGIGNMICGLLGALPMTGVIVRSSANVQAGGKTRLSAILHGAWLLIFVAGLSFLLRMIPTASLAAILVYTGYKLVDPKSIKELWKYGKSEVAIYVTTIVVIVVEDLLTGVLVGVALSGIKLLYVFSHLQTQLHVELEAGKSTLSLEGAATFVRLPRLAAALERVPAGSELHVDFQQLDYIDHACLDLLMNWAKQHESSGGKLVIDWESLHARFRPENNRRLSPVTQNTNDTNGAPATADAPVSARGE
jgi:MFS superfamily sulfate permease-like transporter